MARTAADGLGAASVVGFDLIDAMLTVARRVRPGIDWSQGDVASLPFDDGSFDVVVRQMGLMFFPDRITARQERPESPRRAAPLW